MEELLTPVLGILGQHQGLGAKLFCFVEKFGGGEAHCVGSLNVGHVQWYGTNGFALLLCGSPDGASPSPPRPISTCEMGPKQFHSVFHGSTLAVAETFHDGDREYVVVCNETRGHLARQRTLFLALLREVVEKLAREAAEKTEE